MVGVVWIAGRAGARPLRRGDYLSFAILFAGQFGVVVHDFFMVPRLKPDFEQVVAAHGGDALDGAGAEDIVGDLVAGVGGGLG